MHKPVEYDTARYAKQLGFNVKGYNYWLIEPTRLETSDTLFDQSDRLLAPFQSEVMDWLWDEHKIYPEVTLWGDGIGFTSMVKYVDGVEDDQSTIVRCSDKHMSNSLYEKFDKSHAYEKAIMSALAFLEERINKKAK